MSKISRSMSGRSLTLLKKRSKWDDLEFPKSGSYDDDSLHQELQNDLMNLFGVSRGTDEFAKLITAYLEERPSICEHHENNGRIPPLKQFSNKDLTKADLCAKMYSCMFIALNDSWGKLKKAGIKGGPGNKQGVRLFVAELHFEHVALGVEFKDSVPQSLRKRVRKVMREEGESGMFETAEMIPGMESMLKDPDKMVSEMEKLIDSLTKNDIDQAKMMMKAMLLSISGKPVNKLLEKIGLEMEEEKIIKANFDDLEVDVDLPDKLPQA